jgi:hypothetical protein
VREVLDRARADVVAFPLDREVGAVTGVAGDLLVSLERLELEEVSGVRLCGRSLVRAKKLGLSEQGIVDPHCGSDQLLVKNRNILRRVHRVHRAELAIRSRGTSHHPLQRVLPRTSLRPVARADLRAEPKDEPPERKVPHLSDVVIFGQPAVIAAAGGKGAASEEGHCSGSDRPGTRSTIRGNDELNLGSSASRDLRDASFP